MSPETASDRAPTDPATWLESYGDTLFRQALMRVGRREVAEDIVQETLLAGLRSHDRFSGQSSEQTWLIGILRRKVVDFYRQSGRLPVVQTDSSVEELFRTDGHWSIRLRKWPSDPQADLENREFWTVFHRCRGQLPEGVAAAFVLREVESMDRTDICAALGISASNLSVRLHRARQLLRRCLDHHWFAQSK
jgi:RNA polymerase sigma-70 factor (ECF subfamily)